MRAISAAKGWIKRRIVDPVGQQLRQGTSPEKIALSLAVGSWCAFFPVLGAATPLCVGAGCLFRLNHPLVQAVNWLSSPLYVPIVYGFVRLGGWVWPGSSHGVAAVAMHAVIGWLIAGPAWLAVMYGASLFGASRALRREPACLGSRSRATVAAP